MHPVFYFSKRTTDAESKYSSYELEFLCIINSLKRFYTYLQGLPFKIVTDCDSVRLTMKKKDNVPKIMRWVMYLENFNYTLEHRPSGRMNHVDALSRSLSVLIIEDVTFEQVLGIKQSTDKTIDDIKEKLLTTELPYYELRNGLVYRKEKEKLLFYVPEEMIENVIRTSHESIGHLATDKTIDYIRQTYWFSNMKSRVKTYIENCLKCISFSPKYGIKEGFLNNIEKGDVPFDTLHIDHLGPLEKTTQYHRHVLVVVDSFTKFIKLFPCKSTSSAESIKHLETYFAMYSRPKRIIADRGTCFSSAEFRRFTDENAVALTLIAIGVPRANGQVEVVNRSLTPMLAKLCTSVNTWDKTLPEIEFALNNTKNSSTKEIPSKLLFGAVQRGKVNDRVRELLLENDELQEVRDLDKIRQDASQNIRKTQQYSKDRYDQTRKMATAYKEGDYVMIKNIDTTPGVNKKLIPKFKGPYVVKRVLRNDRYVLEDPPDFQLTHIPFKGTVSAEHMKHWSTGAESSE